MLNVCDCEATTGFWSKRLSAVPNSRPKLRSLLWYGDSQPIAASISSTVVAAACYVWLIPLCSGFECFQCPSYLLLFTSFLCSSLALCFYSLAKPLFCKSILLQKTRVLSNVHLDGILCTFLRMHREAYKILLLGFFITGQTRKKFAAQFWLYNTLSTVSRAPLTF